MTSFGHEPNDLILPKPKAEGSCLARAAYSESEQTLRSVFLNIVTVAPRVREKERGALKCIKSFYLMAIRYIVMRLLFFIKCK